MSVSCDCCVLSGRVLCDGPFSPSEETHRVCVCVWCVCVCVCVVCVCGVCVCGVCVCDLDTSNRGALGLI